MSVSRREFIRTTACAAVLLTTRSLRAAPFELQELTLAELAAGMRSGKWTAARLTELYLQRIAALDKPLASVLYINPDAARDAAALDAERKAGKVRGPLHGIPILIKGNIDTADQMATTAGSLALAGRIARKDAFVISRLRAAGCVLLGKTNLSEWANCRSSKSSSGWSGEGGQTRNPYALDRSPSGSSSGSAVAAAANFCAAAVGTETDGSLLSPASMQALVAIKPTVGLVSRSGIIPISYSQDTAGPMARTVADAAILLSGMTGADPTDPATAGARPAPDYLSFLTSGGLKGARIGVARKHLFGSDPAAIRVGEASLKVLRKAGAVLVDPVDIFVDGVDDAELTLMLYEYKAALNAYLATAGAQVKSISELIAWNNAHAKQELALFGQELLQQADKLGPLTDAAYKSAKAKCQSQAQRIDEVMTRNKLDALFAPTGGPAWLIDWAQGDAFTGSSTAPAAVAGYPAITVPAGSFNGLPLGVSFMGRPYTEGTLIRIAYGFEQATKARRVPDFRPTVKMT